MVKPTEHRACHELDRATPGRRRSRPRQARAAIRYAFDSLMRPAFVVVGDVGRHGAAKVVFRKKMKWFRHSLFRLPMNRSMCAAALGAPYGMGIPLMHSTSLSHRSRALRYDLPDLPGRRVPNWPKIPSLSCNMKLHITRLMWSTCLCGVGGRTWLRCRPFRHVTPHNWVVIG